MHKCPTCKTVTLDDDDFYGPCRACRERLRDEITGPCYIPCSQKDCPRCSTG